MMGRFEAGQGLFIFDGDWESGNFDSSYPGKYGFFLFPPLIAGGKQGAMSAPAHLRHRRHGEACELCRLLPQLGRNQPSGKIAERKGGWVEPGRLPSLPIPGVKPGTVTAQTLKAGQVIAKDNGAMGFIANATGSIDAEGWTPAVESLFAGHETSVQVLKFVQNAYKRELTAP